MPLENSVKNDKKELHENVLLIKSIFLKFCKETFLMERILFTKSVKRFDQKHKMKAFKVENILKGI